MTHLQFTYLLLAYVCVLIASVLVGKFTPLYGNQPRIDYLKQYFRTTKIPKWYQILVILVGSSVMLCGAIGFVGLLLFWRPAPLIYCTAIVGRTFLGPFLIPIPNRQNCWEGMVSGIGILLDGFIIALTLFGPAKNFFY
jgi:hypothetical protein